MKALVILAAVVLAACQAAKVPQEVIQQVTVPVPSSILVVPHPPPPTTHSQVNVKTEIPAQIVEIVKDHKHKPVVEEIFFTTVQPEVKTVTPDTLIAKEVKRKTRAVPFTSSEKKRSHSTQDTNKNVKKAKHSMAPKMTPHRSMRSLAVELASVGPVQPVTENPIAKTSDSSTISKIDPCDLLCTKFEFYPICASNGFCMHEFPNQCILETYNCRHPGRKFSATRDDRCQMDWLAKCDESEMI